MSLFMTGELDHFRLFKNRIRIFPVEKKLGGKIHRSENHVNFVLPTFLHALWVDFA